MADNIKPSMWLNILNETRTFSESRKLKEISVVVVGPQDCGKSELVRSLNLNCTSSSGHSTDYGVTIHRPMEMSSHDYDRTKIHLWCVNGDGRNSCIDWQFQRALNWKSLENCVVLLTASIDRLDEVLPSLESQILCLEKHLSSMERNHSEGMISSPGENTHLENGSPQPPCSNSSFNVPVILVITKADLIGKLANQEGCKDQISFLTLNLRKLALKYSAALMSHSSLGSINVDTLFNYVAHLSLGDESTLLPEFEEADAIFIPHSCDTEVDIERQLESFLEEFSDLDQPVTDDFLKAVFLKTSPVEAPPSAPRECVECEKDQTFLESLQILLSKPLFTETTESTEKGVTPSPRRFSMTPRRTTLSHDASGALTHFFHNLLNSPSKGQTLE